MDASIIRLAKISKPSTPSDTRPITQLCVMSKLHEKDVHRQFFIYLQDNSLIVKSQLAYRLHNSTQTCLSGLLENFLRSLQGF